MPTQIARQKIIRTIPGNTFLKGCSSGNLGNYPAPFTEWQEFTRAKKWKCFIHLMKNIKFLFSYDLWRVYSAVLGNKSDITSILNIKKHVYTKLVIFLFNLIVESQFKNLIIENFCGWILPLNNINLIFLFFYLSLSIFTLLNLLIKYISFEIY